MQKHSHRRGATSFSSPSSNPSSTPRTRRAIRRAACVTTAGGLWARSGFERLEPRVLLDGHLHDDHDHEPLVEVYVPPTVFSYNRTGFLTGASRAKPLDIALNYLRDNAGAFGLQVDDLASPFVTSQYRDATNGITHIYLMQEFNGLGVTNARMNVSVMPDGRILAAGGGFVPGLGELERNAPAPALDPRLALRSVAGELRVDHANPIGISNRTSRLDQRQTVTAPDFSVDPFNAHLQYVAMPDGSVQLGWKMILDVPGRDNWYELTVDSTRGGTILEATDYYNHAAPPGTKLGGSASSGTGGNTLGVVTPSYNVIAAPTAHPYDPSQATSPNRSIVVGGHDTVASPWGWHDTNGAAGHEFDTTQGNNVHAYIDRDGSPNVPDPGSSPSGGAGMVFDFPIDLTQAPTTYQPAAVTNLFYWNNIIHDVTYQYGFTELAGNFQQNNYGRGGLGNDYVLAEAQDGSGTNNANFATPADGSRPRMQMYLWTSTTPGRDGDLDNRIIVHEYGHGISNRLTGGPSNASALTSTQSRGMGEGWSDFFSLLFTQKASDTANQGVGVGTYSLGQANDGRGVRRFPYSYDMLTQPLTFEAYGSGSIVYPTHSGPTTVTKSTQVHATGEIWCSTLWDMTWNLINKHGFSSDFALGYDAGAGRTQGNLLAMKLVMDSLKLQPSNPSVIQSRDAILAADNALTGGANFREIWSAFARRGLGAGAATASASSTTITTAFDLPAALIDPFVNNATPTGNIEHNPITSITLTFAEPMNTASFSVLDDVQSFTGPNGSLIPAITSTTWTNNRTLRLDLQPQRANGNYTLVIGPDITAADDGEQMDQNGNGTPGEPDDAFTLNFTKSGATGPRVTAHTPSGSLSFVSLTQFDLTFNEAMDPASFSIGDDVASFTGPGNVNLLGAITGSSWVNASTLRITTEPQFGNGVYSLVLGPNIAAALDGAVMDQNVDGTPGTPADAYDASVHLDRYPGPDGFGYESNSYPVEAIDLIIGDPGVVTLVNGSDDASNPINLGSNTFNYYGNTFTGTGGATGMWANANGLITFGAAVTTWTNSDLQSTPSQAALAVLWDDWRTDGANAPGATDSAVLYKIDGDRLIVEWSDVCNRTQSQGSVTFQAILELNTGATPGRIIFNYIDTEHSNATFHNGASATAGIKNAGTQSASNPSAHRLLISQNNGNHPWVGSNQAILFAQDVVAPQVSTASFNYLTSHSITVTFDDNVSASLDAADLVLHNNTTNTTVDALAQLVAYDAGTNTATFTFPGLGAALLEDGSYTATLVAMGITDASGNPLDGDGDLTAGGDYTFDFTFLRGDANGDGVVNLNDFNILAANFGQSPRDFSQGDFNYDGTVNLEDFNILASRFGTTVLGGGADAGAGDDAETLPPPPTIGATARVPSGGLFGDSRVGTTGDDTEETDLLA